jgi:hypothetical protein
LFEAGNLILRQIPMGEIPLHQATLDGIANPLTRLVLQVHYLQAPARAFNFSTLPEIPSAESFYDWKALRFILDAFRIVDNHRTHNTVKMKNLSLYCELGRRFP